MNTNTPKIISFLKSRLFLGMGIPLILYFISKQWVSMTVTCTLISGYTFLYVTGELIKKRTINLFGVLAFTMSTISLLGMLILKDDRFYWIQGIVENLFFALLFASSLLWKRSAMQMLAEDSGIGQMPVSIRQMSFYKNLWRLETIVWVVFYLLLGVIKAVLYLYASQDLYILFATTVGSYGVPVMIALSVFYAQKQFASDAFKKALSTELQSKAA